MDISFQTNAIKLISRYLDTETATKGIYPFVAKKPDFPNEKPLALPFKMPFAAGVSARHIADFLKELSQNRELDMHSLIIVKDGAVITRAEWGDYTLNTRKMTHSECKSLLSLVIGVLIGDGRLSLDDKVSSLLSRRLSPILKLSAGNMTVSHLLTMTTGVIFNELGTVTDQCWLRSFFESGRKFPLGKEFDYNSLNSYLLSVIVREVSGLSLSAFTEERIFKPLGIKGAFWEKSPEDIECGGFGLYIFPDDIAKLGLLVLNGGEWEGKQIVPREYLEAATSKKVTVKGVGDFDYGYHVWCAKNGKGFLFNGMFGQNLLCYPENKIIIVSNASNGETFQQGPYYGICKRFFEGEIPKPKNAVSEEIALSKTLFELKNRKIYRKNAFPKELLKLNGAIFSLNDGKPSPAGIMPFILGAIRNYYTEGITEMSFSVKKRVFYFNFVENGECHSLPVGFYCKRESVYHCGGESFRVAVRGSLESKNGESSLVLRISFLEATNARFLKITFKNDGSAAVKFTESPGSDFLLNAVKKEISSIPLKLVSDRLNGLLEGKRAKKISESVFSPTLYGRRIN